MKQLDLFDLDPFTRIPDVKAIDESLLEELEEHLEWLNTYYEEFKSNDKTH